MHMPAMALMGGMTSLFAAFGTLALDQPPVLASLVMAAPLSHYVALEPKADRHSKVAMDEDVMRAFSREVMAAAALTKVSGPPGVQLAGLHFAF